MFVLVPAPRSDGNEADVITRSSCGSAEREHPRLDNPRVVQSVYAAAGGDEGLLRLA